MTYTGPVQIGKWATLHCGDCLAVLPTLEAGSVDAIVTDPPYGLSFMGRKWDYSVPGVAVWEQCLRVLKPGGHLLAFAGTRTQHRMCCNIEDAGFEIRDMIAWLYGSGFPKSLDVSKAIDKTAGVEREVTGQRMGDVGIKGGNFANATQRGVILLRDIPATDAPRRWQGWGTALKPALEPITVARKPLCGTVAENVLTHGTGAINIDECRVPCESIQTTNGTALGIISDDAWDNTKRKGTAWENNPQGRYPANVIHDGSDEVLETFAMFGESASSAPRGRRTGKKAGCLGVFKGQEDVWMGHTDTGTPARFFYCAKAHSTERGKGNTHPTVKPLALMEWLVKLVCPRGGLVLDPFMGSGSTGLACRKIGRVFVGIDLEQQHVEIAQRRISAEAIQPTLFDEVPG